MKDIEKWIYRNKEGAIIGAVLGYIVMRFGLMEGIVGPDPKDYMFVIIFFGMLGAIIDSLWKPNE